MHISGNAILNSCGFGISRESLPLTGLKRWVRVHAMASGSNHTPEEQLQHLFSGCEVTAAGSLTSWGLKQLCTRLHLGESSNELLKQLQERRRELNGSCPSKTLDEPLQDITFDEFREAFVYLLSQQENLSHASLVMHEGMMSNEAVVRDSAMEKCATTATSKMQNGDETKSAVSASQPLEELEEQLSTSEVGSQEANGTGSQPNSLAYSGDNEEEYLRATWQRLGVGHDGYLSLEELATVCHAIGMEKVANEVLEQLFSRLDVDGDGRISFEEFVHMFQNGGPSGNTSLVLDESQHQEVPDTPLSRMSSVSDDRRGISTTEYSVFSSIDPDNSGYASVESILEMWESLSIGNGVSMLKDMGFPDRPRERLSLVELSAVLEEDCRVTEDQTPSMNVTPLQMTVLTYLQEVKFLRFSLESARCERNKLRFDLNEANQRLALLAQELDEHNAHMEASSQHQIQELERQYRDQVRELQEALARERDTARDQVSSVTREMQLQNEQLQQEDAKLKAKLSSLQADMKRLETENLELSEKMREAEKQIAQMERQVADMQTLRNKIAEYESVSPREEEYQKLLDRLERVTSENQQLRDCNDELLSQIDSFPMRQITSRNCDKESSLDGSCLGDYVDPPLGLLAPVKRRGSNSGSGDDSCEEESPRGSKVRRCSKGLNVHYVDVGSYDESFLDTSISNILKAAPGAHLQSLDSSQPASLEELTLKIPRRNSGQSDGGDNNIMKDTSFQTVKGASQIVTKELKQVFRKIRANLKEEYRKDGSEDSDSERSLDEDRRKDGIGKYRRRSTSREELEAELVKLREERDRLAKQLTLQQEEFAHQLEKKEFECEVALNQCSGVREQLEKTTLALNQTSEGSGSTSLPVSSTPVKSSVSAPTSLKYKCLRCGDTQGQLTMALEELEMALRREEQERSQRISVETILTNREDPESTSESGGTEATSTTPYPQSASELSSAVRTLYQGTTKTAEGGGRVHMLEEQCRGLKGELARVRVEVIKMVEERDHLAQQKDLLEKRKEEMDAENLRTQCKNLIDKIRRKRLMMTPSGKEDSVEEKQGEDAEANEDQDVPECQGSNEPTPAPAENLKEDPGVDETDNAKQQDPKDNNFDALEFEVCALEKELAQERDLLEKQKASLFEKNAQLEHNLEMLRIEFDKSEDYWTLKLQEEQDYYEEERRLYDDKFSALEKKIREYEELVLSGGGGRENSEESDRLSTIDESAVWEKQVTELEEEVSLLQKQVEDMKEEKFNIESGWESRIAEVRQLAAQETATLQEQVSTLSSQLHQAQLQVNAVLDELDKVRRDSEQRIRELSSQHKVQLQMGLPCMNGHGAEGEGQLTPGSPEEERPLYQGGGSAGEETINGSLRSQLRQCQARLHYLEAALKQHHTHAHHILTVTREQHAAEVQNLESMIAATQQMLGQHVAKYKDQLSKASRSDTLVKELYLENAQLMRALQVTESRQKAAEEASRRLQVASLGSHTVS